MFVDWDEDSEVHSDPDCLTSLGSTSTPGIEGRKSNKGLNAAVFASDEREDDWRPPRTLCHDVPDPLNQPAAAPEQINFDVRTRVAETIHDEK